MRCPELECDEASMCDGTSTTCPVRNHKIEGTDCASIDPGECKKSVCDGQGTCGAVANTTKNNETCANPPNQVNICNAPICFEGDCTDVFTAKVCEQGDGLCKEDANCTGSSATCPTRPFTPDDTPCSAPALGLPADLCNKDACLSGVCVVASDTTKNGANCSDIFTGTDGVCVDHKACAEGSCNAVYRSDLCAAETDCLAASFCTDGNPTCPKKDPKAQCTLCAVLDPCKSGTCDADGDCVEVNALAGTSCSGDPCKYSECNGQGTCVDQLDICGDGTACANPMFECGKGRAWVCLPDTKGLFDTETAVASNTRRQRSRSIKPPPTAAAAPGLAQVMALQVRVLEVRVAALEIPAEAAGSSGAPNALRTILSSKHPLS